MEIPDVTQAALGKAMQAAQARHEALAENIANANTPGYRRRDVQFTDALARALEQGRSAIEDLKFAPVVDPRGAVRVDGGTVDIDEENAAMAANRLHYEALIAVKQGRGDIFKTAAGIR